MTTFAVLVLIHIQTLVISRGNHFLICQEIRKTMYRKKYLRKMSPAINKQYSFYDNDYLNTHFPHRFTLSIGVWDITFAHSNTLKTQATEKANDTREEKKLAAGAQMKEAKWEERKFKERNKGTMRGWEVERVERARRAFLSSPLSIMKNSTHCTDNFKSSRSLTHTANSPKRSAPSHCCLTTAEDRTKAEKEAADRYG